MAIEISTMARLLANQLEANMTDTTSVPHLAFLFCFCHGPALTEVPENAVYKPNIPGLGLVDLSAMSGLMTYDSEGR